LQYGTSLDELAAANSIVDQNSIRSGQLLAIPCSSDTATIRPQPTVENTLLPPTPVPISTLPSTITCSNGLPAGLPPSFQYILGQLCATQNP
jgi:hypothetical protein